MKIRFDSRFTEKLSEQVDYISKDSPTRARNFKKELLASINGVKDNPYSCRKSYYFDDENIRDLVFMGYCIIYELKLSINTIEVFGFVKYQQYS